MPPLASLPPSLCPHSNKDSVANGRITRMILTGLGGIVVVEIYAAVMQRCFQNTDNQVGKGFAILGIYLFVVIYCKQKDAFLAHSFRSPPSTPFLQKKEKQFEVKVWLMVMDGKQMVC